MNKFFAFLLFVVLCTAVRSVTAQSSTNPTFCTKFWLNANPVANVNWELRFSSPTAPPASLFTLPTTGCYELPSILPTTNIDFVRPGKDNNHLNGVNIFDVVLMARHLLNIETFANPYQYVAADADRSGSVTTYDIVEIGRLLLGIYTELPQNTSWRFVLASHQFPSPDPLSAPIPEATSVPVNATPVLFNGVKIGDVTGDVNVNNSNPMPPVEIAYVNITDRMLAVGEEITIPVSTATSETWSGCQFSLVFDPAVLTIESVQPGPVFDASSFNYGITDDNELRMLWYNATTSAVPVNANTPLMYIRVKALANTLLSQAIAVPEAGNFQSLTVNETSQSQSIKVAFQNSVDASEAEVLQTYAVRPNPTRAGVSLPFALAQAADVQVELFNALGQQTWQQSFDLPTGTHQVDIPAQALPEAGIYTWRITAGKGLAQSGTVIRANDGQ
jgi:Cohesin domain